MGHINIFDTLQSEQKMNFLMEHGELIDSYAEEDLMVYMFILEDSFICMKSDESSDVTTMKVSKHPQVLEDYIEGVTVLELV